MTQKEPSKISVIIPTYNEAGNLPALVKEIFDQSIENLNLLIIDDSSPDGTAKIVNQLSKEFPGKIELIKRKKKLGEVDPSSESFFANGIPSPTIMISISFRGKPIIRSRTSPPTI